VATPKIIADFESSLSTAVAIGGTSFTLASATDDDGVALPSGLYYFTVDNGSSNKEYLSGTLSGTSVTSVVSVSRQGTETSGAARAHRVGASVIITDFATYKKYMDGIALVSAPDADTNTKGVSEQATQAEVDAGTTTGGTSANLFVNPSTVRAKNYNDYVADTGSADAYAIAPSPAITAYAAGQVFTFKAVNANTGASTLAVNGLAAKSIVLTGAITAGQIVQVVYDGTDMQMLSSGPDSSFGDGSDGDVTISTPTTLTRDMYYNNLVVTDTLTTNGFAIYVKGTISGVGTIKYPTGTAGGNASGQTEGTAGTAITTGRFRNIAGGVGAQGRAATSGSTAGVDGTIGGAATPSGGVIGGAGGNSASGGAGIGTGGAGGVVTAPLVKIGAFLMTTIFGLDIANTGVPLSLVGSSGGGGGAGGSSGGGSVGGGGGGGGASGGIVFIVANIWAGTFTIQAIGGAGGAGSTGNGNGGGGGGGGGGVSIVFYRTKTWSGSYVLTGGAAGATGGSGASAGNAGTVGASYEISAK